MPSEIERRVLPEREMTTLEILEWLEGNVSFPDVVRTDVAWIKQSYLPASGLSSDGVMRLNLGNPFDMPGNVNWEPPTIQNFSEQAAFAMALVINDLYGANNPARLMSSVQMRSDFSLGNTVEGKVGRCGAIRLLVREYLTKCWFASSRMEVMYRERMEMANAQANLRPQAPPRRPSNDQGNAGGVVHSDWFASVAPELPPMEPVNTNRGRRDDRRTNSRSSGRQPEQQRQDPYRDELDELVRYSRNGPGDYRREWEIMQQILGIRKSRYINEAELDWRAKHRRSAEWSLLWQAVDNYYVKDGFDFVYMPNFPNLVNGVGRGVQVGDDLNGIFSSWLESDLTSPRMITAPYDGRGDPGRWLFVRRLMGEPYRTHVLGIRNSLLFRTPVDRNYRDRLLRDWGFEVDGRHNWEVRLMHPLEYIYLQYRNNWEGEEFVGAWSTKNNRFSLTMNHVGHYLLDLWVTSERADVSTRVVVYLDKR